MEVNDKRSRGRPQKRELDRMATRSFSSPQQLLIWLDAARKRLQKSLSAIVTEALESYLSEHAPEDRPTNYPTEATEASPAFQPPEAPQAAEAPQVPKVSKDKKQE